MKRLVFCFDGTWNKLNEDTPTNVVLTAASIMSTRPRQLGQLENESPTLLLPTWRWRKAQGPGLSR